MSAHLNSCPVCKTVIDKVHALPGAEVPCPSPDCRVLLYFGPEGWRRPTLYSCGCSHLKVQLGRCDVFDEAGRERAALSSSVVPTAASELERRSGEMRALAETTLDLLLCATDEDLAGVDTTNARALVCFIDGYLGTATADAAGFARLQIVRAILLNPSIVTRAARSPHEA